jgi:ethanolamine utilization protein EutA
VLYTSPPLLTPYETGTKMDVSALETFVRHSYADAGLEPEQVDTGVVVVTGEALNKENAEEIANLVSGWSGDFICVSAGANTRPSWPRTAPGRWLSQSGSARQC